ncbi:hypothetical protein HMPREF9151_02370 [Hoylesella saccharolytica F0055]|uniref:Uncharacterized protein n=1 Tax=Hoylesella saccharolytica F0055 TaxID=1127699 RepID=L1N0G4_9BACT|nr:hypothetical protein [Hoylesella saccharolytica]EKX96744.1 hypothetical protein HMPREF9151_02370 [Hoylesella saccharolytica F0055]
MEGKQAAKPSKLYLMKEKQEGAKERKKLARMYGEMMPRILANFMVNGAVD